MTVFAAGSDKRPEDFEVIPLTEVDRLRARFGKAYDDAIARHRLRQAFGRLIRRADDKGVFVMLDARCPSRLLHGLPPGVLIRRLGLAQAVAETRAFLAAP